VKANLHDLATGAIRREREYQSIPIDWSGAAVLCNFGGALIEH
jgi:hypothetical protein